MIRRWRHVNDPRAQGMKHPAALNGPFGGETDTFAIPGIRGKIDDPHDGRDGIKGEGLPAHGKFAHLRARGLPVAFQQAGQLLQG